MDFAEMMRYSTPALFSVLGIASVGLWRRHGGEPGRRLAFGSLGTLAIAGLLLRVDSGGGGLAGVVGPRVLAVVAVLCAYLVYRFGASLLQARLRLEAERAVVYDLQATLDLHGHAQEALAHQALHDDLTGLPNRALLLDRLTQAIVRSKRTETTTAVLFLDLDRFTWVNDRLGHNTGDELLVAVADRLRLQIRPEDTIARFGGDEFVVLCEGLRSGSDAIQTANRLITALSVAFHLGDRTIPVTASIGIAHAATTAEESAGELLRDADSAMHRAKDNGRNRIEVFDESVRLTAMARLETESALRRGIHEDRFKIFYQPVIEMGTGRVVGTEALVRWERGNGDLVAPNLFIPLAEETGLIVPIGALVLREACRQTVHWNETICRDQPLTVAVNISPCQLATAGLTDLVAEVLAESALPPSQLCLEITETVLMEDAISSEITLAELKRLGVDIAIDDFGTGYSSLMYLRRLPIDILKIDRSFVAGLGQNLKDSAIVHGVLGLARSLGLRTVAEGVENPDQATRISDLGCEFAQGFLWSRPVPPTAFTHWLEERAVGRIERPASDLAKIPLSDARR